MPLKLPKKKVERKVCTDNIDEVLSSHEQGEDPPEIDSPLRLAKALRLPEGKLAYRVFHMLTHKIGVGADHIQDYAEFINTESKVILGILNEPRMSFRVMDAHFNYLRGLYFTYKNSPAKYKADVGLLEPWEVKYEDKEKRLQDTLTLNKKAGVMLLEKNEQIRALKEEAEAYRRAFFRSWIFAASYVRAHNVDIPDFREYLEGVREEGDIKGVPEHLLEMFSRSKNEDLV